MSSISAGETKRNYDVFLSFRGEDTRETFTRSLYDALCDKGIITFKDHQLRTGEEIAHGLLEAIEESRISIIVFSENYASSTWCLDELVKILECNKERNQLVWPIFYIVEPSDVRHQRNRYGDAMTAHENRFGKDSEKVQKWRSALSDVSAVSEFHFKEGNEYNKFIEEIVSKACIEVSPQQLYIDEHIVGLEPQVEEVKSLLDVEAKTTTCMLGIHGARGIGKTTLAKALYNSICNQFEVVCFLFDVREKSNQDEGLKRLQQTLLSKLIKDEEIKLTSVDEGTETIKTKFCQKRVLIVLDDIDEITQLENLIGKREYDGFGSGSRIIITTRNKDLLDIYKVEKKYEMKVLNDHESLELFCQHAFKMRHPQRNYEELCNDAIRCAKGLPLALKEIGSYCFGHDLEYWRSALNEFEKNPREFLSNIT